MWKFLVSWLTCEQEVHELALRVEASVRKLSGLPEIVSNSTSPDVVAILQSTCTLLDRLVQHFGVLRVGVEPKAGGERVLRVTGPAVYPNRGNSWPPEGAPKTESTGSGDPKAGLSSPTLPLEPELSVLAQELIKVRDWILLAKAQQSVVAPEVLEELYWELGRILAKEHVIALEDTGSYDATRQRVVDTCVTDNTIQRDMICRTVRPGYLFYGKLVRPQDVILYTPPRG